MPKKDFKNEPEEITVKEADTGKYRYVCHGCTKNAGYFNTPSMNMRVTCPHCQMDQLTKLENFIYEA